MRACRRVGPTTAEQRHLRIHMIIPPPPPVDARGLADRHVSTRWCGHPSRRPFVFFFPDRSTEVAATRPPGRHCPSTSGDRYIAIRSLSLSLYLAGWSLCISLISLRSGVWRGDAGDVGRRSDSGFIPRQSPLGKSLLLTSLVSKAPLKHEQHRASPSPRSPTASGRFASFMLF